MIDKAGATQTRQPGIIVFWAVVFLAGLTAWLFSFMWTEQERVWRALLISFLYFTSLAGGLVVWLAMIEAAKGRWAVKHEATPAAGIAFFVPGIAVLFVLWAASSSWAPWYGRVTPQGIWLDNSFLFARQLIAAFLFWSMGWLFLRLRKGGKGRPASSFFILLFAFSFSLHGFDLVMALDFYWYSSLFGGYFFISALYIAIAAWGLIASWQPDTDRKFRNTVASLVLAFSILTTYMMFCQLLPIWYENLARETRFIHDRLHFSPAREITFALLLIAYLGPLLMLLTRSARESRIILGLSCSIILISMWIERWWLVAPTFSRQPSIGITELASAAAFLGILGGGMALYMKRQRIEPGGGS